MKKKILFLFMMVAVLIPVISVGGSALPIDVVTPIDETMPIDETVIQFEDGNITFDEEVNGSTILGGNTVEVDGRINGISILLGNNVRHRAFSDYGVFVGNSVIIDGTIKNEGFILGNLVSFDKEFQGTRDLFIFGNEIILRGNFSRDITIFAVRVIIEDANILGNITIYAGNIEVKESVIVLGDFSYNEAATVTFAEDSEIANIIELEARNVRTFSQKITWELIFYGGLLLIFIVLSLLVPNLFKRIENQNENITVFKTLSLSGFGLIALILIPMISILLLRVFIGFQLSLLLLAFYVTIIFFAIIFTGYLLGLVIWKKLNKKDDNMLLIGLIGITIIYLLRLVPYIGPIVLFFNIIIGMGIVLKLFKRDTKVK